MKQLIGIHLTNMDDQQSADGENSNIFNHPLLLFVLALLTLVYPAFVRGQVDHGTVVGTITDSSGAVVPSVDVTANQVGTDREFKAVSSAVGFYSLQQLPVGTFKIKFHKGGYKDFEQVGVVVEAQHTISVNPALQVGNVSETVTVTATPVLELQTEVGTNMDAEQMDDQPTSAGGGGRDITSFAFNITPNVNGSEWTSSIAGSQNFTKAVLIDGTSADSTLVGHIGESEPSMDAIQEMQVDTTGMRAEDGRSGGGAMLFELKSGTNRFHGDAFGILANEFLNANTWDNNWYIAQCGSDLACQQKYRTGKDRYFDYGGAVGGPIWKKWLGIKKMYIYAVYEKYQQDDWRMNPTGSTVPSEKMLTGDFSEMLTAAATAQGLTTCPSSPCPLGINDPGGNPIYFGSIFQPNGNVYPGNMMPTGSISPLSQQIVSLYQKYYKPTTPGLTNNFPALVNNFPSFRQTQLVFKYDWELRDADHIAVSFIYTLRPRLDPYNTNNSNDASLTDWQIGTKTGGPLSQGQLQTIISPQYRINERHIFSSNKLNVLAFTVNLFQDKFTATDQGNYAQQLGFGNFDSTKDFPLINFQGSPNGLGENNIGTTSSGGIVYYNAMLNDTFSWSKGRHTMKFGTEYREIGVNDDIVGGPGTFNFSSSNLAPVDTQVQTYAGSAFANFLLGEVSNAAFATNFIQDSRQKEISFFGQDDFHLTRRLTLSADLRWELTRPMHVLHGDWTNFDVNAPSQAYFGPSGQGLPGAITWLQHPGDSFETYIDWHQFAPKLGASFQLTNKIVIRGSAGLTYVPLGSNGYNATPYGAGVGYQGVNQVLPISQQTPAYQWDSGYPGAYVPPTGPQPTSTYIPWGPANVDPHSTQLGFVENWYAGVQYQLPGNSKIEVSYIGSSGRNLHDGALVPTNYPTWSTYQPLLLSGNTQAWVSDQASAAAAGVPYPFAGFSNYAAAAINPYPQVANNWTSIFFTNTPIGQSGYNAFTVEGIKQHGSLNFDLSFNMSRTTGNTGSALIETWTTNYYYQDPYKYKQEAHWPYTQDQVKGYVTYGLPFGRGRKFLSNSNRLVDALVSGYKGTVTVWYGNGTQMGAIGSTNDYPGWSGVYTDVAPGASFKNTFKKYTPGWNPTAPGAGTDPNSLFMNPNNFSNATFGQLGNSPTVFSNWRGWATPNENATMMKRTKFGSDGRYSVILRAEFYDVLNRHWFSNPNTSFGTGGFGHVMGILGENRTGQLGARFEW